MPPGHAGLAPALYPMPGAFADTAQPGQESEPMNNSKNSPWRNFHFGRNDPQSVMHSQFVRELHQRRIDAGIRTGSITGKRNAGLGTLDLVQQTSKFFTDRLKP